MELDKGVKGRSEKRGRAERAVNPRRLRLTVRASTLPAARLRDRDGG